MLVDLETTSHRSHSFVFTTPPRLEASRTSCEPRDAGEGQPLAPAALTRGLLARFRLLGTHGLVGMAISAIDMAAWDALARAQELPLCRLLGAAPRPTQAYGGVGYDGVKESASVAERWAKRGLKGVKAKIGYPTVAEDLAVVRAMRSAVGPDVALMVDYNQSLAPGDAIARLRHLEGEGLTWIEEPVIAEDYAGMARVARAIATPIQAGENWWGPLEFEKAIDAEASDFLMPDVMKVFGVTGWMDIAALAAARICACPAPLLRGERTTPRRDPDGALARVRGMWIPCSRNRWSSWTAWRFPPIDREAASNGNDE